MLEIIRPTLALSPYVMCMAATQGRFLDREDHIISARGVPMLMFPYKAPSDTSFIHGLQGNAYPHSVLDSPALLTANDTFAQSHFHGEINFVMVILQITGAYHFLRGSVLDMSNQVNLLDVYGLDPMFEELQERLWETQDFRTAAACIERYLLTYFTRKTITRLDNITPVTEYMTYHSGLLSVQDLTRKFKCSERWLEKQFAIQTGLSPKKWLRLLRFRAAASYWQHHPACSWLDIVVRFGYTDQSHLTRDFKQFAGSAPANHFEQNGETESLLHINDSGMFGTSGKVA